MAKTQEIPAHVVAQRYEEFFTDYMFALATLKNICTNQIEEYIHIPKMNTPPRSRHDILLDTKAVLHTLSMHHKNLVETLTTLSPSNAIVQKAGKQ